MNLPSIPHGKDGLVARLHSAQRRYKFNHERVLERLGLFFDGKETSASTASSCSFTVSAGGCKSPSSVLALEDLPQPDMRQMSTSRIRKQKAASMALSYLQPSSATASPETFAMTSRDLDAHDMYFVAMSCTNNPNIRCIDLSNSRITKAAAVVLLNIVNTTRQVVHVLLEGSSISMHSYITPVPQKFLKELQAKLEANVDKNVRLAVQQDKRETLSSGLRRRADLVVQALTTQDTERTERIAIIRMYNEVREEMYMQFRSAGERLVRLHKREIRKWEKRRKIHALGEAEEDHRQKVFLRWLHFWEPLIEKIEFRLRVCLAKGSTNASAHIMLAASEEWIEARQREKARFEEEKQCRVDIGESEMSKRKEVERQYDKQFGALRDKELLERNIEMLKVSQKLELLKSERMTRNIVTLDEGEAWTWVLKKWDIAEQHRISGLEKQRLVVMNSEGGVRDLILTEEEVLRPILHDLIRTCTGMAQAREIFSLAAVDRRTLLGKPPLLAVRVPDTKPDRYILKQHLANACAPPRVAVETAARIISELPVDWEAKVMEVEQQEAKELMKRKEEYDKQIRLHAETQEKLGTMNHSEHVQRMMQESLMSFSAEEMEHERKYIDCSLIKKRKEQILGGTLTFSCVPYKELPPLVYKQEELYPGDDSLLVSCTEIPKSRVTKTVRYPGTDMLLSAGCKSLVLHVPKYATVEQVQDMLRGCHYSTTYEGALTPLHRPIRVSVKLYYINVTDDSDPYLAEDFADELPSNILEIETTGCLSIVLCPPYLFIPPESRVCTFTEGDTVEKSVFLTDLIANDQPIINRLSGVVTVASGNGTSMVSFEGGEIVIDIQYGYTADDVIAFKSGSDAYYSDVDQLIRVKEEPVMKVLEGVLCKTTVQTTGLKEEPSNRLVLAINTPASAEVVRKVLQRLRFYNVSQDPVEGPRQIRITLKDDVGSCSMVKVSVVVEATDNPTTLGVPVTKKFYHFTASSGGIPQHLRQHIVAQNFLSFDDVTVCDVDTDRFCGGFVSSHVSANYQRGDLVGMHDDCFTLHYKGIRLERFEADPDQPGDPCNNLWCVWYRGCILGCLGFYSEDKRTQSSKWPLGNDEGTDDDIDVSGRRLNLTAITQQVLEVRKRVECRLQDMTRVSPIEGKCGKRLHMQFDLAGGANIEAAQAFVRAITFIPVNKVGDYTRTMELEIQVGMTAGKKDTEGNVRSVDPSLVDPALFQAPLKAFIQVKVTPPLITVSGKASLLKYTEGSGPVRLAPFEIAPENTTDGYEGGFMSIDLIEGSCEDDVIGIREEGTGIILKARETLDMVPSLAALAALGDKYEEEKTGKRVRAAAADEEEPKKVGRKSLTENKGPGTVSEVYCDGKFIGILAAQKRALYLTFLRSKLERERVVGKKEVMTITRALTYTNVSKDPQELTKVARVTVSDSSPVVSQAIIEVQIQPVDDVTDVLLRHERLRYRPCNIDVKLPFLIAPLGDAIIEDPDTEYFDGGYLSAELIAGPSKGDSIGLLSLPQQREQIRVAFESKDRKKKKGTLRLMDNPEKYLFEMKESEKKIVALDGSFTALLSYPQTKNCRDANDIRIAFPKVGEHAFSKNVLSFLLNCITFGTPLKEKLKEGPRTILIKVSDGVNPQDGRAKVILDVRLPFLFQPSSVPVTITPGGMVAAVAPKLAVNYTDNGPIVNGFLQVDVVQGFSEGDCLVLNLKESGFTLKDGAIYLKAQNIANLTASTSQRLRLEFTPSSRATQKAVGSIVKSVGMKFSQTSTCHRVVVFTGTVDRFDRVSEVQVTLTLPLSYKPP